MIPLYQIAKGKKGFGLAELFSILAFALITLIIYATLKIFIGQTTFEVRGASQDVEERISVLGILRTPVNIDGHDGNVAELIALSKSDTSKKLLLKKNLLGIMDSTSTSKCNLVCIDGEKFEGSGCVALQIYECSTDFIFIPGYDKPIQVSFKSGAQPLNLGAT